MFLIDAIKPNVEKKYKTFFLRFSFVDANKKHYSKETRKVHFKNQLIYSF